MSLVAASAVVATSVSAFAVGTVLFDNLFNDRSVDGTGTVTKPATASGAANVVCLTASGNNNGKPLGSCSGNIDTQGSGKLRLTGAVTNEVGGIFGATSFPTSNGLDVTFNSYQWGGNAADGIAFMLAGVDPANPVPPAAIGTSGGALGYSAATGANGLTDAYLGVGLDVYGNFSSNSYSGTGCSNPTNISTAYAGAAVVRGPGNGRVGYCGLSTTNDGSARLALRASTRSASVVPVQVLINPSTVAFTANSGVSVSAGTYKVVVTPVGQATRTLSGSLPAVPAGMYPSAGWLNPNGVPKQLAFGFVGSTGGVTDVHEVSDVKVLTFNPVPQLGVSTTSYVATTPQPGDPVSYVVAPSVLAGANETVPISVTQSVPAGVVPVGAYGAGWVCQAPVGQSVTCTTSGSSFANGTSLPAVTVDAIVTSASMTATIVQTTSTATVSSSDANPGTDSTASGATVPPVPTGITISPTIGPIAGGGLTVVTASSSVPPTAIEIGTTAEQQSATPVVLLPCPSGRAAGCFNVEGSSLVIAAMPARATPATVTITVVTLGIAGTTTYVYADRPAPPATPTATAGVTSATVAWTAPATNGGAITGYVVTPYLAGVAQTPLSFDASTTTRVLSGLTPNAAYTFTVAAVNAFGTSAASAQSAAVTPYTAPGAPTITAVSAGTSAATLTWTAPANGGSAITGYVVTPYIGAVAQTTQNFSGTATTRTVVGLTAGTAYTFTVAAQNLAGLGPASAKSASVTPNVSPSLTFPAPPTGEVGVTYSQALAVTNGTAPFAWSVSSGALPAGMTLNTSTGLLSGTPTAAGSFSFIVQVVDASGATATKAVTLVIAAAPTLAFSPVAGEVGVPYSQQPTVTGGTGPFAWTIPAGSLPAGVTLNATTGLVSGTPTVSGSFSVTVTVTDAFNQVASRTVAIAIAARPVFNAGTPPTGQVGVSYSTSLGVTGGTVPLTWSIAAGSLPPGLSLNASTGAVTGTPTASGSYPVTASVVDAFGQTATKALTLVINSGPIVITKAANVSSAASGSTVTYTITVANTGTASISGIAITDPLTSVLDDSVYNSNATATSGTLSYTAPTLGWTGTVGASSTVTITYSVTVNSPDVGNKVLANTVSSTTLGTNCAGGSGDARCTSTVTVPGLTIVKTADVSTTTPGSTVHFRIVVTNTGQTAYAAATLSDSLAGVLDDATYNADALVTTGNISYTVPNFTWTGALAVGASATITYSVTVAIPDNGDHSLTGTVVSASAGSPCPSGSPGPQCTATVAVLIPALSVRNTADVATVTPGGVVHYTLTLANTGQTAYTGASVNLALQEALDEAVYNNDATASAGVVTYNAGTGTLVWTGNLAIGAVVTVTVSVTVRPTAPGNDRLNTVANSTAAGSTCPPGSSNSLCATSVAVLHPELTISKAADASTTTPGSVVHYTVTATNTGQTNYSSATFTDNLAGVLDDATYNGDASTTAGALSYTSPSLTWTGSLAIGATATVTYSVTVKNPDPGNLVLTGSVSSATAGSTCPVGGTPPAACTSSVAVLIPAVSIVSSITPTSTTPGSVIHYTAVVTNTGQTTYTGLAVTLDLVGALDDATYNYDAAITTGNLVPRPDGTVDWVLNLAPGATATGTISMTVNDPDTGDRSILITAVSDNAGSSCPTSSPTPSCNATATVLVPGLTITKTADKSTVSPGGTVGYTVVVLNTGQSAYAAASFTDNLNTVLTDAIYSGGSTASTGTVSYSAPTLAWTGSLAPGASATVFYQVTVRNPDPGDKQMINTIVSSSAGTNCLAGSADLRCTATVNVLVPKLTIVKTANSATTAPGGVVRYTVGVTNSGATPFTGAAFADALGAVLDDATYNSDATATLGTVSYAGSTLGWTGNLAVGATATITYSVTVHSADGGNNLLTNTITSTTSGNDCPTGGTDTRCTVIVPVARLVLAFNPTPATVTPGSTFHVGATYTNTGQVPYNNISVSVLAPEFSDDVLPGGDQTASSGTFALGVNGITWEGDIPVGAVISLDATVTVQNPDTGNKLVTATTVSSAPGNNCPSGSTDSRCSFAITVVVPALTITKVANTTATVSGAVVGYTITVHNTGQTSYTGATVTDSMAGLLDDADYDNNASATSGLMSYADPVLSWTGDLAVGATVTITYSVTVRLPDGGDKTMVNSVTSSAPGSTCPAGGGHPACTTTVVVLTPSLTIVKTASLPNATLGSDVTYTVKVTNSGQTGYTAAAFTDSLSDVLDDATYGAGSATSTSGTATFANSTLSWSGALAPGASATVTYTVTINSPSTGNRSLANTVVSTNAGSNCPSGGSDPRCTVTVAVTNSVSLTFTKTADVAQVIAGGVVHYTVSIVNSSVVEVADANFTDPLGGMIDDATYNGDAATTDGSVTYTAPNLHWHGTIAASSTVTVTYSVIVHSPLTGNQILTGTISSTSLPSSNDCVESSTDPRCTNTVVVAALVITQSYAETSTTPGSLIHLSATFTNVGQMAYNGITIASPSANTIDDAIPSGDEEASSGTLVLSATAITWTGSIPVGGVVTVTGTLSVKDPDAGNKMITGTLVSTALGNNCLAGSVDARCSASLAVLIPALTIVKSANATFVVPGAKAAYTITVTNSGQTPYSGATVSDALGGVLDDATYDANAVASTGAVVFAGSVLTWTGDLGVGDTATITYSVTTISPATGDKTMVNAVSSTTAGNSCPVASGNSACRSTVAVLTPALDITSAANAASTRPGATVIFTVTAINSGQLPFAAATLSVPLAGLLDDATYSGNATSTRGTVSATAQALSWAGSLNPGESVIITYSVIVDDPVGGDYRLDQTVTSSTAGSSCSAGDDAASCSTSVPIASLRILSQTDVSTTVPAGVVHYTVTLTNVGQVAYTGASLSDSFAEVLDDAIYNGDARSSSGNVIVDPDSGAMNWIGHIAVGDSVVITASVTVANPDTGNKSLDTRITSAAIGNNCPAGNSAAACATSVTVLIPVLAISKAADKTSVVPGAAVSYTITVANTGPTTYTAATVSDSLVGVLNDATYSGGATATRGAVVFSPANSTLTWSGDLASGETAVISYSVVVNSPNLGDKTMRNAVVSDALGSTCPTGGTGAACSVFVTVLVQELDIAVSADRTVTVPGATVGYTVTIRNTGQTDYLGATVTAALAGVLDDAIYPGEATATTGTVTFAGSNLNWTGDLTAGTSATITYRVTVTDPDAGNRLLTTSISSPAPGSTCGSVPQCTNVVSVLIPGLAISTTSDVATATPGDVVTFTLTVVNTGQTVYPNLVVTTSLSDVLDDASFDGHVTAPTGVATYAAPTISWQDTLDVGETAVITYEVTIANPDTGNHTLSATAVSSGAGSPCGPGSGKSACTASVTVLTPALGIAITASSPTTTPGGVVGYRVVITNTGQTDYQAATVVTSLAGNFPDTVYGADAAVVGGGTLTYAAPNLTWTGALAMGATATITYSITVRDPDPGDKFLTTAVTSPTTGSSCPAGTSAPACSTTVRVLVPDLVITKTSDVTEVVAGSQVHYTLTLANTGQTAFAPATLTDALAGVLDDAVYNGDAAASTGDVILSGGNLVWTGPVALAQTVTVTYSVTTSFPALGDHVLTNSAGSTSAGSTCRTGDEAGCTSVVSVLVPGLHITKTADTSTVVAGGIVHYTLNATNTGQADYPSAMLTDSLAGVLDDGVYRNDASATEGAVAYSAGTLTWTGAVPRGADVTITYSVAINIADTGDAVLINRVTSQAVGSTCPNGSADPECATTTAVAARSITLSGLTSSFSLNGLPHTTVESDGAVTMTVTTNSPGGYQVTVQAESPALTGTLPGNSATIPINLLQVRESGTTPFLPMSNATAQVIHRRNSATSPSGDAVSNDFRIAIPFVAPDTYSATVDYIAATQ